MASAHRNPSPYPDDTDMLESLIGLNIKNFGDSNDGTGPTTPSSTNASLPTPPALRASQVYLASELMSSNWFSVPPNAPLLKDSDSFTDGTGHSTFDFPLPSNNQEIDPSSVYPLIYHPTADHNTIQVVDDDNDEDEFGLVASPTQTVTYTNTLALDLLPQHDREVAVRAWVEGVSATSECHQQQLEDEPLHPRKRRRSLTATGEVEARRVRAWTPTVEPSHAPQPGARRRAYPEAPD
jgi:hypothetical protein